MPPAFPLTLALYAVSCTLYLAHSSTGERATQRLADVARIALAAAFVSHAVDIGYLCVQGTHPFVDVREVLSFLAWLTIGAYLATTFRYPLPLVGALLVPVTIVLDVAARLGPARGGPAHASTLLGTMHIGLATAGVAIFAVAAVDAAVYLVAEGQLKRRRFGPLFKKGPPLEKLDQLNRRCILLGFPLFTVAMITGTIWVMRLQGGGAHRLLTPQYAMSTLAWVLFAGLLVARVAVGLRGRRAALVTLAGFGAALGVVAIYYLRGPAGV
ncbi:MAG: hypothetical protein EXR72_03290 [Myxococcales bacterium]|nr:hypothetical protein [Myxococcales bacterium]